MSPDAETPPFQEWHAALRERDAAMHSDEDARTRLEAVGALEARIAGMNAELRALGGSVAFRGQLLDEQRVALAERDARITALGVALQSCQRELAAAQAALPRRLVRRARRLIRGAMNRTAS